MNGSCTHQTPLRNHNHKIHTRRSQRGLRVSAKHAPTYGSAPTLSVSDMVAAGSLPAVLEPTALWTTLGSRILRCFYPSLAA